MTIITRFAPSPTGFLHIGGARTALFNWLFAKANDGKFLLRIEDTDKARSTKQAIDAILDSMKWLGIDWDGEIIYQSQNIERHKQIAEQLVTAGKAYHCYCSVEELQQMREKAQAEKRNFTYNGKCRHLGVNEAPTDTSPVVRIKAPTEGKITIHDEVQGDVSTTHEHLDDMILLRSDGTPTYMLAVVVDDHDMGVTNIIRGDDHLTNSARQKVIYDALGWQTPTFSHIPLIHGADGAKLSKRHGALGAESYREMGYLPEAMTNYLLRLGWSHGNDETISRSQAIEWFNVKGLGKSPSRFDIAKLNNLNAHYIREASDDRLAELLRPIIEEKLAKTLNDKEYELLSKAISGLKQRVKTLLELADNSLFYFTNDEISFDEKALLVIASDKMNMLPKLINELEKLSGWNHDSLFECSKSYGESIDLKLGKIMEPVRVAITGSTASPSMFEVMELLGKNESLRRLKNINQ